MRGLEKVRRRVMGKWESIRLSSARRALTSVFVEIGVTFAARQPFLFVCFV